MINYLMHHGVKNQQWGITHGPPYPIDPEKGETKIKAGSKIHRLSTRNETAAKGHAYVTTLKSDQHHYKGFFGLRLHAGPINWNKKVYDYEYVNTKDLVSPSKQKRVDTFLKMYEKDPLIKKELNEYYKKEMGTKKKKNLFGEDYSKNKTMDDATNEQKYDVFKRSLGSKNDYIRTKYIKQLKKEGYNYVIDDLDAGTFGKEPSIIFEREKNLQETGRKIVSKMESIKILKDEGIVINKEERDAKKKEN